MNFQEISKDTGLSKLNTLKLPVGCIHGGTVRSRKATPPVGGVGKTFKDHEKGIYDKSGSKAMLQNFYYPAASGVRLSKMNVLY